MGRAARIITESKSDSCASRHKKEIKLTACGYRDTARGLGGMRLQVLSRDGLAMRWGSHAPLQ
jgi:hypothetical protein